MRIDRLERDQSGAAWQAQRAPVGATARFGDTGQRAGAEPSEQRRPVERRTIGEAQRECPFRDITTAPPRCPQLAGGEREHLARRVIELADALEAGRKRHVRKRQVGRFDQRPCGLRALRTGDRERAGAQLTQEQTMKMALADGQTPGQAADTIAVDDPVGDQAHRSPDQVAAHVPFRRTRRGVRTTALAGAKPG